MSVPTRGLSDMLDALTGRNQDDENKRKIHVTDEVQMHRLAASSAGSPSSLCLPGLPSASVATNFAQDQQNTWKMLMDVQQQMISFLTGLMRALETATVAATAAKGAADAAQGSGRPSGPSGPPEPASVPNVRLGQITNRIHPIKELHDEALKYFEKQALLHERNVLKLVRTKKEIDRLMSVISAMEQSKYNELKFIYPPGTSPFKAPSDVAEMNEALQESLENDYVLSFTIPKGTSRRNAMNISHHASNTFIRKVTLQAQNAHLASVKTLSSKQVFLASCASLKFKQHEWPDLGLEDVERQGVDPKAAEYHALEIYRKMIDKVRQKAAVEEKKKDDDLKKKEVSKKLEDEKPGNLLVSVVRKVIKEEQNYSSMGVETDSKEGFKDIVKVADDCASKVGSGKGIDKDKVHKIKGKGNSLKKETSQIKSKSKEIQRVIPREKEESPHYQIERMEKVQKTWNPPAGPGGRIQGKVERKTQEKVVRKEKTTTARVAAKQEKVKSDLQ